jgi:hypothetical protein
MPFTGLVGGAHGVCKGPCRKLMSRARFKKLKNRKTEKQILDSRNILPPEITA